MIETGENCRLGGRSVPVPLHPPQISHGLTQDKIQTSGMKGQQLTALNQCNVCSLYSPQIIALSFNGSNKEI
jgi:hypothetical protein